MNESGEWGLRGHEACLESYVVLFSAAFETHYGRSETTGDCVQVRSWQLAYQSLSRQGRELAVGQGRESEGKGRDGKRAWFTLCLVRRHQSLSGLTLVPLFSACNLCISNAHCLNFFRLLWVSSFLAGHSRRRSELLFYGFSVDCRTN